MSDPDLRVTITQRELEELANRKRELNFRRTELKKLEKDILALLEAGAEVEKGRFVPKLQFHFGRESGLKVVEHAVAPVWRRRKAS